ncbi:hypothetical protein WDW89_19465 [Deltaproteobacteria bacterium TL4]
MLQTVEAIVDVEGRIQLLEPLHPEQPMQAIVTLLKPVEEKKRKSLKDCIGSLKNSSIFEGDPLVLQKEIRDEWH